MLGRDNMPLFSKLNHLMEKDAGQTQRPVAATCVLDAIAVVGNMNFIARTLPHVLHCDIRRSLCGVVP